jgi:ribose 5-phosphate isomerase B
VNDTIGSRPETSRRHNNLNVLCLSADMLSPRTVERMVEVRVNTPFEGGRHERRIEKIYQLEQFNP